MRPVIGRLLCQTAVLTLALGFVACTDAENPLRPPVRALFTTPTGLVTANPPQIFVGAGDITSCGNNNDEATAKLLDAIPDPATVYVLGDDAYDNGSTAEFANCYDPTWGRHKYRTKPSAGNHEYNTSGAAPYFAYFGAVAGTPGQGWYSYSLGAWHIIVLNSNLSTNAGGTQDTWLKADLAAHPNQCTLAYYHHPLYSSTGGTGSGGISYTTVRQFVNDLYAAHADLILNGHRHFYERLAPMNPSGGSDPVNGVREIIAGMGGIGGGSETNLFPLHQAGDGSTFGVLKLYLYDDSYAWKFIPVAGKTYTDSGSTACHSSGGGGGPGGVSATTSTVSANPTSFTAGTGSSTITVTAKDANGNTLSGSSVVLASTGSGNTFTPPSGTTNGSGVFTSTFTSTVAEGKTISANIDGTAITQTASVTVSTGGGGGNGTITQTLLTSGSNAANQSVYTTASISPAANALVTVAVLGKRSSGALTPTLSGGGITTWTQVASVDYDPIATPASRLVVFRGMSASPGSGPITITYTSSMSNATWMVSQWTGVDQTGTAGSGAIGQTGSIAGDATTSLSKALVAFGNANNVGFGVVGVTANPPAVTPGAGSSEIGEVGSTESTDLETQSGVNDNTIAATLSAADNAGLLAIEIKAGSSGPAVSAANSTVGASTPITAGGSPSTITVTAKDGSGNPISGATVVLAATGSGNTLTQPSATTNASGVATGTLASTVAENKTVSATINGVAITQTATVTVNPGAVSASNSTVGATSPIIAGTGTSTITVTAKDANNNLISGATVVLAATGTGNTLTQPSVTTNASGVTTGTLASTDAATKTVSATINGTPITQTAAVVVNPAGPAVSAANSSVLATSPITAGSGTATITVTVLDGSSNPLSGVTVTLSATGSGNSITQPAATDANGVTTGTFSSTAAGTKTITAVAGGITLTQQPVVTVTAGAANAGQSTVGAAPTSITVNTGTSTVTVTVKDAFGNPVGGSTVVVSASGTGNSITQPVGPTGANGVATATFGSSVAEGKTLSATADGTAITQTASVTVTNQPPPGITQTLLTSGHDPTNTSTFTTGSIAPAPNALVTVAVLSHQSSAAVSDPILTGAGMTWQVVASVAYDGATPLDRLTIYRAMSAAPGSGPLMIKTSATVSNCQWIVSQWSGVDQSGTNGSGAIVQTGSATGAAVTTLTATLAAFASPSDVAYGVFGIAANTAVATPGSGFTTIDQQPSGESSVGDLFGEWAVNLPAVTATWPSKPAGALSVEIKAGP